MDLYHRTFWQKAYADIGLHWLTPSWWRYLLAGTGRLRPRWIFKSEIGALAHFACRMRGHPCGVVWFNVGGLEPDMHCRNCGDDCG